MNVLVSCAGRRGALLKLLREATAPIGGKVFAIDASPWSSACRLADGWRQVPRCRDERFIPEVLDYCRQEGIRLIVPTTDTELPVFAGSRERFAAEGVRVAVSGPETVQMACDKRATHEFLVKAGMPAVRQFDVTSETLGEVPLPAIVKPRFGSSGADVRAANDPEALAFYYPPHS